MLLKLYCGDDLPNDVYPPTISLLSKSACGCEVTRRDYSRSGEFLEIVRRYSPEQTALFQKSPLYGLVLEEIVGSVSTNQFTESRYLDEITTILIWLIVGTLSTQAAQKEKQQLLSVLRVSTSRDSYRFHNTDLQEMLLRFCGPQGKEATSIAWFYCEYCMKWLEECLNSSNRKMFSKESVFFFFELLMVLAKNPVYRIRVATIMAAFPMFMFSEEVYVASASLRERAKQFIITMVKEGFG